MEESLCVATNGAGAQYEEFSCLYPSIEKFYFDWEKYYDPIPVLSWVQVHPIVPVAALTAYGLLITVGRKSMEDKEPWAWRKYLAAWNLLLSVFSIIGTIRTAPQLAHNLYYLSLRDNMCMDPQITFGSGSTGLWVQLFVLSKFPELIDTFFIVIHKKPLIFLHWYHHITVLAYCWHSYATKSPFSLFFIVMNFTVHGIMYGYYFLMAIKMKPKWFNAMFITTAQITQMVVGVLVTIIGFYHYMVEEPKDCHINYQNTVAAFLMYGSYLVLFLKFFIGRYSSVKPKKSLEKKSA